MACQGNTTNCNPCNPCAKKGNGFLLVIVLYILLAILLGSYFC